MCNWRKWIWPGILAVAILTALSTWFRADVVEGDLTAKATSDLAAEHPWSSVELDGRDLTLKGVAPSDEAAASALQIADSAYDVRVAIDGTEAPAVASPFILRAEKNDGKITLTGNYPDEDTRTSIVEAATAAAPGFEVVDEMTLASGAPEGFSELGAFALSRLQGLSAGAFELSDSKLAINGLASGMDEYDTVIADLAGSLPGAGEVVSQEITPPTVSPYNWAADYDGSAVTLTGLAPNADARTAIEAAIQTELPDVSVTNNLRIAAGAPAEFKSATDYAAGFFPLLSQGRTSFEDNAFSVSGVAKSSSEFVAVEQRVGELPSGYTLADNSVQPVGVSPFVWSIKNDGETITLDGFSPSVTVRDETGTKVQSAFPDANVVNNLRIAGGEPTTYAPSIDFSVDLLKHFSSGEISISDSDVFVEGKTDDIDLYDAANAKVADGVDGATIQSQIEAPAVSPYRWSVAKNANGVTVRGNAKDTSDAEAAIDTVKSAFGSATVTDRQVIGSGQPAGFSEARDVLSSLVNKLEAGQGNMVDQAMSVTGRASSEGLAKSIETELQAKAPAGFTASANILWPVAEAPVAPSAPEVPVADPYRWSVSKLESGVTVLGNVADEAEGASVIDAVKSRLAVSEVTDKQVVAQGKPDGFDEARILITSGVRYLEAGQGNIIGNKLSVTGRAKNENIKNLIDRVLEKGAPAGFETSTNIVFPKSEKIVATTTPAPAVTAEACQQAIVDAVDGRKIQFETARAVILPESEPLLKSVLDAANKCPQLRIQVAGHTDSRGSETYNQGLSEARAQAVLTYLTSAGMSADRLEAKGFGETSPIETNDTAEGRSANRRIEFNVLN